MIITIDGPAGSGKTTTARYFALHYRLKQHGKQIVFSYMNSGSFYRAIALWALGKAAADDNLPYDDIDVAHINIDRVLAHTRSDYEKVVLSLEWSPEGCSSVLVQKMLAEGSNKNHEAVDINKYLYSPQVSACVAQVSCYVPLREALTKRMQDILSLDHWIVEGRDAGTKIAPKAVLKIYLDVSDAVRTTRRYREYVNISENSMLSKQDVKKEILERDAIDKNKGEYSLRMDSDTHYIQADVYSIEQICDTIYNLLISAIHL